MSTSTFYATGGYSHSDALYVYVSARAGTGSPGITGGSTFNRVGQEVYTPTPEYYCEEVFARFDLTPLAGKVLLGATLALSVSAVDGSGYNIVAAVSPYRTWVAGASLAALTTVATIPVSALAAFGTYYDFTDVALLANLVTSGYTELILYSSRHAAGNTPTGIEDVLPSGVRLIVTWEDPGVHVGLPKMSAAVTSGLGGGVDLGMEVTAWSAAGMGYRNACLATVPAAYWRLGEAAPYGPNVLTGGTASASSDRGGTTYRAAYAVDGDAGTRWATNDYETTGWWKYDLGSGVTKRVEKIGFYLDSTERTHHFTVEGSNNDSSWTNLYTGDGADNASWQYFTFDNATGYRYLRISISTVWAGIVDSLTEIEMYERIYAADATGNGHVMKYVGSPTFGAAGALSGDSDTAIGFAATTSGSIYCAESIISTVNNFTMAGWIKVPALGAFGVLCATGKWDDGDGSSGGGIYVHTDGTARYNMAGGGIYGFSPVLTPGTWVFLAVSQGATAWQGYVNGAPVGTPTTGVLVWAPSGRAYIGAARMDGSDNDCPPAVDEVAFWTRPLTAAEIATLYAAAPAVPAVAYAYQLAVLQGADKVRFQHVLNDVGAGSFDLALADPKAVPANIHEGNLIKVRTRGLPRFGFFVEAPKLSVSESGASVWTIAGRGVLSALSRAVIYPPGWPSPSGTTRTWTSQTAGTILGALVTEAQARGALPGITAGFTATTDSAGGAFAASITVTMNAGITVLDAAKQLVALGYTVEMTPDLVLNLYKPGGKGAHLETLVILRQGKHVAGATVRVGNRAALSDVVLVHGSGNVYIEAADATMRVDPYLGRREGSMAFGNTADTTTLGAAGTTAIAQLAAAGAAISVPLTRGMGPGQYEPYVDYAPGDWVTLDVPGQYDLAAEQVVALTLELLGGGNVAVTADLNAVAQDYVARLKQKIDVLAGTSSLLG